MWERHTPPMATICCNCKFSRPCMLRYNLVIGMEMFPRSSQPALDEYIQDEIMTEKDFIKQSRYFSVWGFDYRLYRDIIGFCQKTYAPIIGLNLEKKSSVRFFVKATPMGSPMKTWQLLPRIVIWMFQATVTVAGRPRPA